jgi:adenosylmethionine-8-amino-7-oxononanoate aminotransferase
MSIKKVGNRSAPSFRGVGAHLDTDAGTLPGLEKTAQFYQDASRLPTVDRGAGVYIYDTDGKEYLDGCSGAVAANLGHAHPRMLAAAVAQLKKIAFAYRTQFTNEPADRLAELLVQLSPPELNRAFFVNSGSEAVESATKLARQYWRAVGKTSKSMVLSRRPSYHGATLGALALTDYAPLNIPFRPMLMQSPKVSAPFCYHCPISHTYPDCEMACVKETERSIHIYGPENVAAIIVEPIGGSTTGAAVPPDEYFPMLERICNENEILLIVDDVMTGCGRTGTFYGYEHWDITPDIVCSSKGLSGGYTPIGAIIASDAIVEPVMEMGGFMHGHTYAANPLSCAIALEAINVVVDEHLVENARDTGTYMHQQLHGLMARYPFVGDVRGRGLLAAMEFVRDRERREPFPALWNVALEAKEIGRRHGLLLYPRRSVYGLAGDHVLIAPPLVITREEVDDLIARLDRTLADLLKLVEEHLIEEARDYQHAVDERYHQVEDLPDYALGELDAVAPVEDANVTGHMTQEHVEFEADPEAEEPSDKPNEEPPAR